MHQRYLIGTLFEEEELNKKMNINSVKNKDPMGNVRWKGAFTGGFEAGYRNTVGSKQGWVPTSMLSSSNNKKMPIQQSIFDFMDKQDLGRQAIGHNLLINNNFAQRDLNPFNISISESMGEKMLSKMKKNSAFNNAPQDIKQLQKLLQNYEKQQILHAEEQKYNIAGVEDFKSVGAVENIPDDDFIVAYQDFFRKVIRTAVKQQTEQQIAKRRQQNKIYFDFTKPLQEQPEYLQQIQQIQQVSKPKKKRKNVMNEKKLKDLFILGKSNLYNHNAKEKFIEEIPAGYDPFHRVKNLKNKQKQLVLKIDEKKRHRIHNINQRSDVLNEGKLASKFVSASSNLSTNKFIKSGQELAQKQLQKVFDDQRKNKRYWDYVHELEGKKISAQLEYFSYEETEKQKQEFDRIYKIKTLQNSKLDMNKGIPKQLQQAIKSKNKKQVKIVRKTGFWKPEKLLCKRFGCVLPYKQEDITKQKFYK